MRNAVLCGAGVLLGIFALFALQPREVTAPTAAPLVSSRYEETAPTQTAPTSPSVIVTEARVYTFTAMATSSVESLMQAERAERSFSYETKNYPTLGSFLESINGVRNASGMYWMLYINGARTSVGMSQAVVVPGDRVEWRYE